MAKKKTRKPAADDKVRFETRFDPKLHQQFKQLADGVGVSVNQLLSGMAMWAVDNAHAGEPGWKDGCLVAKPVKGVVFFGKLGYRAEWLSNREAAEAAGYDGELRDFDGELYFSLDFTERRIVVEKEERTS